jgi:hypothetical protein
MDVGQDLPEQEADLLARLLVMVRLIEPDSNCRESQLHALARVSGLGSASLVQIRGARLVCGTGPVAIG